MKTKLPNRKKRCFGKNNVPETSLADPSEDHESNTLRWYVRQLKEKLLTPEEEIALVKRIKKGSNKTRAEAREQMIKANLRLVVKIAREDYSHLGMPLLDLIGEGNVGMMKAVERFELGRGAKFATYAAWWIKQKIRAALAEQSRTIGLPKHIADEVCFLLRTEEHLQAVLGHEPTDQELAKELGVDVGRISKLRAAALRPVSLATSIGNEEATLSDIIEDSTSPNPSGEFEEKNDKAFTINLVRKFVNMLPERQKAVISFRFGLNGHCGEKTLKEVGAIFHLTRERIRQIQALAFRKFRELWKKSCVE